MWRGQEKLNQNWRKIVGHREIILHLKGLSIRACNRNMGQWLFSCPHACVTLCNPMNCNLPGSSVHGIFQARILEWVAISYSRGSSWPRDGTHVPCVSWLASGIFTTSATWEAPSLFLLPSLLLRALLRSEEWQKKVLRSLQMVTFPKYTFLDHRLHPELCRALSPHYRLRVLCPQASWHPFVWGSHSQNPLMSSQAVLSSSSTPTTSRPTKGLCSGSLTPLPGSYLPHLPPPPNQGLLLIPGFRPESPPGPQPHGQVVSNGG